jgi:hypothetical protein
MHAAAALVGAHGDPWWRTSSIMYFSEIYFWNIQMKHLQHTYKTLETYRCNIRLHQNLTGGEHDKTRSDARSRWWRRMAVGGQLRGPRWVAPVVETAMAVWQVVVAKTEKGGGTNRPGAYLVAGGFSSFASSRLCSPRRHLRVTMRGSGEDG